MINPKTQRFMADRMRRERPINAHTDHSPMLTVPDLVIDLILEAAGETLLQWSFRQATYPDKVIYDDQICCYRHRRKSRHWTSHGTATRARFLSVVLAARNKEKLEKTATEVRSRRCSKRWSTRSTCANHNRQRSSSNGTLEHFGRIDALLNIAGAVPQIDLFEMTDAQWDDGMALKLNGARRLTLRLGML